MKRRHAMPFGTECLPQGGVRFRLWAPNPNRVDLLIHGPLSPTRLLMQRTENGWREAIAANASSGSRYQFLIDGQTRVPDPASRFQPDDVHGPSEVIDPDAFEWADEKWRGRPWEEAAIYELHVGAFSSSGTFQGVEEKLDYLAALGVTAIELMPLSDFSGKRNWGYDGVLPFAPDSSYGHPDSLKRLVQAAHRKGLMVLLDVVYNHFGPDGNYLRVYAPQFFTDRHCTPWGDGINFDGEYSRFVRDFFIHNALYWLEEFHLDGLRIDAVNAIQDDSVPDILRELARTVRETFGADRHIHLVLENDDNVSSYLQPGSGCKPFFYDSQWNDDIHHVCQVLACGESDGYYSDYQERPIRSLGKCLTEGFLYQGAPSIYRGGKLRGEPSSDLPPTSFVSFLQNHDQIGNRAFGERILAYANPAAVRALLAILLLAPSPPLLFMGEEFACTSPFLFFCDFHDALAKAVTEGRRAEFAKFSRFGDESARSRIPDPNAEQTFIDSKLDWAALREKQHANWLDFYRHLLTLRQKEIVPLLRGHCPWPKATYSSFQATGLKVCWKAGRNNLQLLANLGENPASVEPNNNHSLYATFDAVNTGEMPPWSVIWNVES